ncbi:MAG: hypothetical protein IJC99_04170 [Clostridia bacterium]|nr:hypothetical protein [Clostridia bacterium]
MKFLLTFLLIFGENCVKINAQGVTALTSEEDFYMAKTLNSAVIERPEDAENSVTTEAQRIIEKSEDDNVQRKMVDMMADAELQYREIAVKVVNTSFDQLKEQNKSKTELKKKFSRFFRVFISLQFAVLIAMLVLKIFFAKEAITETIIVTYITAVFVETLGVVAIMIKYAFNSDQEVNILSILNGVIKNYQKFN